MVASRNEQRTDAGGTWKTVRRTGFYLGKDERAYIRGNKLVVERFFKEQDLSDECTAELVKSKHSSGYYVALRYRGKTIVALGIGEAHKALIMENGFRIVKAEGAEVSFRVKKVP